MTTDFTRVRVETPPAKEPVTLEEAKSQVRVVDAADEAHLDNLIQAGREICERYVARSFINRTLELVLVGFPENDGAILLPRPPLGSVTSIKYTDTDGNPQTLEEVKYQIDKDSVPPRILPAYGETWPTARELLEAVVVEYVAGYGEDEADVPWLFKQAVLLQIADLFEHREPTITGTITSEVETLAVRHLLGPSRVKMEH